MQTPSTRITPSSCTTIDCILTSNKDWHIQAGLYNSPLTNIHRTGYSRTQSEREESRFITQEFSKL